MKIEFEICDRCHKEIQRDKKHTKSHLRIETRENKGKWASVALCEDCENRFFEWMRNGLHESIEKYT